MEDGDKLAVEQFMQTYYRWMQTLSQLNDLLIEFSSTACQMPPNQIFVSLMTTLR